MVFKTVCNVVNVLNDLMPDWIKFPIENMEIQNVKVSGHTQFPGVIGAIDGAHIAIVPQNAEREQFYINRKLYHSLNVSNYEGRILTVNAADGGRKHDARVWRASIVSNHLKEMYTAGQRDAWFLSDSAYPLLPYLMTPELGEPEGTPSARYTQYYVRARSSVKRCIGVLKGGRGCLRKERAMHYAPEVATRTLNAACVLHNILIQWGLAESEPYYDEIDPEFPRGNEDVPMVNGNEACERIINMYFQNEMSL